MPARSISPSCARPHSANWRRPGKNSVPRLRHTARARRDLLDIWLDIASDNSTAADRVYDRLDARVKILERFPELGTARPEIAPEARVLVEPPTSFSTGSMPKP